MKAIGIDLDGTLAEYKGWQGAHHIGAPYPGAAAFLRQLRRDGWTVCIWTTRARVYVQRWLKEHSLEALVDYINESPYPCDDHKRSFDVYVGDEAVRFDGDYMSVLAKLTPYRHWSQTPDSFTRDPVEGDRNPLLYYKGTGKLYLDAFDGVTENAWFGWEPAQTAFLTICSHAKPYSKSWIHTEIRKHLWEIGELGMLDYIHISSAGIVPHSASQEFGELNRYDWNGADITDDRVKDALRHRIAQRLRWWWDRVGQGYARVFVYLRPTGNTLRAVRDSGIPCTVIPVAELPSPPWTGEPDVDDCLADPVNLTKITEAMKK